MINRVFNYNLLYKDIEIFKNKLKKGFTNLSQIKQDEIKIGPSEKEAVYKENKLTLYHYNSIKNNIKMPPVLISYALVNRPYMLDLSKEVSMIKGLVENGIDIYLIDWGYPGREDMYLSLDDYINGYLNTCVDFVCKNSINNKVNLLGICQGGVFSLCYASIYPEKIHNLITMVTPVDFHNTDNLLGFWVGANIPDKNNQENQFSNSNNKSQKSDTVFSNKKQTLKDESDVNFSKNSENDKNAENSNFFKQNFKEYKKFLEKYNFFNQPLSHLEKNPQNKTKKNPQNKTKKNPQNPSLKKDNKKIDADLIYKTFGNINGNIMNLSYLMLKPFELNFQKYTNLVNIMDNKAKLINFLKMESWIFDSPDQAGKAWSEFIKEFYQKNNLIKSNIKIGQKQVKLSSIKCPILNILAEKDHLVNPDSTKALSKYIKSKDYTEESFNTGHIGIYVSKRIQKQLIPVITNWLLNRK